MVRKNTDRPDRPFRMAPAKQCRSHFALINLPVSLVFRKPLPRTDDFRMDLVFLVGCQDVVGQRFVDRQLDHIPLTFQFGVFVSGKFVALVGCFDLPVQFPEIGFEILRMRAVG